MVVVAVMPHSAVVAAVMPHSAAAVVIPHSAAVVMPHSVLGLLHSAAERLRPPRQPAEITATGITAMVITGMTITDTAFAVASEASMRSVARPITATAATTTMVAGCAGWSRHHTACAGV